MNAIEYVREGLKRDGKQGLYNPMLNCSCSIKIDGKYPPLPCVPLMQCDIDIRHCEAYYVFKDNGVWEWEPVEPEPECDKCKGKGTYEERHQHNPWPDKMYCTCPAGQKLMEDG